MTYHVDFSLRGGGRASASFTAPREVQVRLARDGAEAAGFQSGAAGGEVTLGPGAYRVTATYRLSPSEAWVPMDVDAIEDTAARGVFRASAYVGSTIGPGAGGTMKLEAVVTVQKS